MPLRFDTELRDQRGTGVPLVLFRASHDAMATTIEVTAYGPNRDYLAGVANEVFDEIDRLERQMSLFRPESELCYINRAAALRRVIVEPGLFGLIREAIRYSSETAGAFDITVGPLMKVWGFFRREGRVPEPGEMAEALKSVGFAHVKLDAAARLLWFDRAGVQLDLGGLGKGFAVDRAAEILRSSGVTRALISSGTSSIYALGAPPDATAWTVNLRDPFDPSKRADIVRLKNCSLSTSGNYENFFTVDGKTYAHIIDPLTGRPVEGMLSSAVVALTAVESEALSTAFFVMGPERAEHYVSAHANLSWIAYLQGEKPGEFSRTAAQSSFNDLPLDVVAHIDVTAPPDEARHKVK